MVCSERLISRPIAGPHLERSLGIITRKDQTLSPAAEGFYDAILQDLADPRRDPILVGEGVSLSGATS